MSYTPTTYHTLWRDPEHLDHTYISKVIATVQDASSWAEIRDVLMRYYVPFTRLSIDPESPEWHQPTRKPGVFFLRSVYKNRESEVNSFPIKIFDATVKNNRIDTSVSPYERVGRVYALLREWKKANPHPGWNHKALKRWMHQLLIDYTLCDLRRNQGAVVPDIFSVVKQSEQIVDPTNTFIEWTHLITKREHNISARTSMNLGKRTSDLPFENRREHINTYLGMRRQLEQRVYQKIPIAALVLSPYYGVARELDSSSIDLGNHMLNYALLCQSSSSLNDTKAMWIDYLSFGGKKWSTVKAENNWNELKKKAYADYSHCLFELLMSSPMYALPALSRAVEKPNYFLYSGFSWLDIAVSIGSKYPGFYQNPRYEALLQKVLSTDDYESYQKKMQGALGVKFFELFYNNMNDKDRFVFSGVDESPEHISHLNIFDRYMLLNQIKQSVDKNHLPADFLDYDSF